MKVIKILTNIIYVLIVLWVIFCMGLAMNNYKHSAEIALYTGVPLVGIFWLVKHIEYKIWFKYFKKKWFEEFNEVY